MYIFSLFGAYVLFDNIHISKKAVVMILDRQLTAPVSIHISQNSDGDTAVAISPSEKSVFSFRSKKIRNQHETPVKQPVIIKTGGKGQVQISSGPDRLTLDIKYLKEDASVEFNVKPHNRDLRIGIIFLIAVLFTITASLTLPISRITKNLMGEKNVKAPPFALKEAIRSFLINLIFLFMLAVSIYNVQLLKNYSRVIFALVVVVNFWIFVFTGLTYFWVFPATSFFEKDDIIKIIKKTFLITFDNIITAVFMSLIILLTFAVLFFVLTSTLGIYSVIILLLFPGMSGVLLYTNICFSYVMRMY